VSQFANSISERLSEVNEISQEAKIHLLVFTLKIKYACKFEKSPLSGLRSVGKASFRVRQYHKANTILDLYPNDWGMDFKLGQQ